MTQPPQPLMRRESAQDRRPWGLILALSMALMVGAVGLPLQFVTYRQIGEASKAEQLRHGQLALCEQINSEYPNTIFFTSKLIFASDNWFTRLLHNQASLAVQRRLHLEGLQMVILPMKV